MSRHDPTVRLRHKRDFAAKALTLAGGKTRADLDQDELLCLALSRLVELVGEAAGQVSPEVRAHCPQLPWGDIVGMRNRLIHGYDYVDYDILWEAITSDLPPLIAALDEVLARPGLEGDGAGMTNGVA